MKTNRLVLAACLVLVASAPAAVAGSAPWLIPPVDGRIFERFDAPDHAYGAGHRGIDFAAEPGTAVRAAAEGVVFFAGESGPFSVVTLVHDGGISTTYSVLAEVSVSLGQRVSQGTWIGRTGMAHGRPGLHFGVKRGDEYVDPEELLGPADLSRAIRLVGEDEPAGDGDEEAACKPPRPLERAVTPPNDNIVVAVAGIGTKTEGGVSADMYLYGPEYLGYEQDDIYRYSYKGTAGPGFHEPYSRTDSWGDIREAAEELGEQLRDIALAHPGRRVDIVAHSQGGVVARTFLALQAQSFDPTLPPIDHLVTFSSPHRGAPGAGAVGPISSTLVGDIALDAASWAADRGSPIPDPKSPAVAQLAPNSELMDELGGESLLFGTRALALGIPFDAVVPADRAEIAEEEYRVVPPHGLENHSGILTSPISRRLAYDFLRDAPSSCTGFWDRWGPASGTLIGAAEWGVSRFIGGPNWLGSVLLDNLGI